MLETNGEAAAQNERLQREGIQAAQAIDKGEEESSTAHQIADDLRQRSGRAWGGRGFRTMEGRLISSRDGMREGTLLESIQSDNLEWLYGADGETPKRDSRTLRRVTPGRCRAPIEWWSSCLTFWVA